MANVKQKLLFRNKDVSTVINTNGSDGSLEKPGRPNRQKEKVTLTLH